MSSVRKKSSDEATAARAVASGDAMVIVSAAFGDRRIGRWVPAGAYASGAAPTVGGDEALVGPASDQVDAREAQRLQPEARVRMIVAREGRLGAGAGAEAELE